jgi:hypothetical protein
MFQTAYTTFQKHRDKWFVQGYNHAETRNRVLSRILAPKSEDVAGGWRRLHNKKLQNSYASPNTVRVIKSRRMRVAGDVARMGEINTYIQSLGRKT